MSNINLIIEERAANIGNFLVGRLLPFRQKRMIGPFCFIDHMGPTKLLANQNLDVLPHPHIGLSTLTFLFEGSIYHRDSLGNSVEITPGAVNWMTAGKGIVHSERTPEYLRQLEKTVHGLQVWVALPKDVEQTEPSFTHIEKQHIPHWNQNGIDLKLIAGEAFGRKSPVPIYSSLYMIEISAKQKQIVNIAEHLYGESGLYILEGNVEIEGNRFGPNQILVANDSTMCEFTIEADTTVYIFGGEPFTEPRFIDWNFVSSSKETIHIAKQKWINQEFDKIPNDNKEFVPYPI
ncbi:MAG: pirin family protein [Leptonema sp. (in: Bacteria)]|nr:pirin family protein [Leptonema sp. (in: bacteria)]